MKAILISDLKEKKSPVFSTPFKRSFKFSIMTISREVLPSSSPSVSEVNHFSVKKINHGATLTKYIFILLQCSGILWFRQTDALFQSVCCLKYHES